MEEKELANAKNKRYFYNKCYPCEPLQRLGSAHKLSIAEMVQAVEVAHVYQILISPSHIKCNGIYCDGNMNNNHEEGAGDQGKKPFVIAFAYAIV